MTPKIQLVKGLAALIDSLDSTPRAVVAKPIADEDRFPLYNVQNSTTIAESGTAIKSPYTEDYLRDMFTLKPLGKIEPKYK